MPDQEQAEVRLIAARLRQEHEDFDVAINAMIAASRQHSFLGVDGAGPP